MVREKSLSFQKSKNKKKYFSNHHKYILQNYKYPYVNPD